MFKRSKQGYQEGIVKGISGYKQLQMRHFALEMLILKAVGFQIRLNVYSIASFSSSRLSAETLRLCDSA